MTRISMKISSLPDFFDPFDPAPEAERRLSDGAAAYLLASLRGASQPDRSPVVVVLILPARKAAEDAPDAALGRALQNHFARQAQVATNEANRIRLLGRIFVPIGFLIMCVCMLISEGLTSDSERHIRHSIAEGVLVLGWVALWAPFDYLLFGRLPALRDRALLRRLADAEVLLQYADGADGGDLH
jgi:hypothetical protein